ncbi:viroplasmin family protein [Lacticigenium naphthae]|uniref:ribonuclease H1 domain-containing protein n=1 Tax=Lacticigenium naphthae TaxID=515351 RepID=UPI00040DB4B6|nr:ribonuclease H family protein [Lacticigenium naphthae]
MPSKYYAIKKGRKPGIYRTWAEAQAQIKGFSGAQFKSFPTEKDANEFIDPPTVKAVDWTASDTVEAYVDGSFNRKKNQYSYGVVMLKDGQVLDTFYRADNDERYVASFQIAGEVFGALEAIRWAKERHYTSILIHYDYMGIEQWATGMWKANKPVSKDYIHEYKELAKDITVRFKKEKAHTGIEFNELADQLAKKALQ